MNLPHLTALQQRAEKLRTDAKPTPWFSELCNVPNCWCETISNKEKSDELKDCIIPTGAIGSNDSKYVVHSCNTNASLHEMLRIAVEALKDYRGTYSPKLFKRCGAVMSADFALTRIEEIAASAGEKE